MDPERYAALSDAFARAVELGPDARAAYVEEFERDAPDLGPALRGMLVHDVGSGTSGIFAEPRLAQRRERVLAAADAPRGVERTVWAMPERIGPYRVLRLLGEGGMGTVYACRQTEPIERTVAVKVVRSGRSSSTVLRRFELEREVLSRLDDPGIARVLDAGLTREGLPYFAMEFVEGQAIDRYCDEQGLELDKRLRVFVTVARAIEHAHRRGVLHRDLKPSNVMVGNVDGHHRPKVIDFGLARAVDSEAPDAMTRDGEVLGTFAYMSPEQARVVDADVDTRTDIYSLGVLLYELLTGRLPSDSAEGARSLAAMFDRHRRTPRPSERYDDHSSTSEATARSASPRSLRRRLRGDLDWIVMRAIAQHPDERYGTAGDLAADVEAYLSDRPVSAGPPSTVYRLRKLVRRHRLATAALAAAVVALVAATIVSSRQAWRATRAEASATDALVEVEAQNDVLRHMLTTPDPRNAGADSRVVDMLARGVEHVTEEYSDRPRTLATVLGGIGGNYRELGQFEDAERCLTQAVAAWRRVEGGDPRRLAYELNGLGILYARMGRGAESRAAYVEALDLIEGVSDSGEEDLLKVASWQFNLGRQLLRDGDIDEAERRLLRAHELHLEHRSDDARLLCFSYSGIGEVADKRGETRAAIEAYERSVDYAREAFEPGHVNLAGALVRLGGALVGAGELERAGPVVGEAWDIARRSYDPGTVYLDLYFEPRFTWAVRSGELDEARELLDLVGAPAPANERPEADGDADEERARRFDVLRARLAFARSKGLAMADELRSALARYEALEQYDPAVGLTTRSELEAEE